MAVFAIHLLLITNLRLVLLHQASPSKEVGGMKTVWLLAVLSLVELVQHPWVCKRDTHDRVFPQSASYCLAKLQWTLRALLKERYVTCMLVQCLSLLI